MLKSFETQPLLDGLKFAEGPRWRDGRLWFSDIDQDKVMTVDTAGRVELVAQIERPSGLGFLPDGALLVVGMRTRKLFRVQGAVVTPYADLSEMGASLNDLVVTPDGRAYVDCYRPGPPFTPLVGPDGSVRAMGHDINRYYSNGLGVSPSLVGDIALVTPDGAGRPVAAGINYPNGLGVTPDGRTLVASVSHESKLIAFDILADGGLSEPRLWADLPGRHPDGLCFDAEGAVWVASVATSAFLRVLEGGQITHLIPAPRRWAVSLALGAEDRRTLFMVSMEPADVPGHRSWIDTARVDVPGAGLP